MNEAYIPLISGFVGALIGSLSSIGALLIQTHFQKQRELTSHAIDVAMEDFKVRQQYVKEYGGDLFPLEVFIQYHLDIMKLAAKDQITPKALEEVHRRKKELMEAIIKLSGGK